MTTTQAKDRSQSRGREFFASSGRGGAGNIRSFSQDASKVVPNGGHDDDGSDPRGREFAVSPKVMSSGRGGAGNIRSPSKTRSPSSGPPPEEKKLIDKHIAMDESAIHSSGRGGYGNITNDRSRSRDPPVAVTSAHEVTLPGIKPHSTGRGGAGNITREGADAKALTKVEEAEILEHAHTLENTHLHSTGRGGLANMTRSPVPPDAKEAHHDHAHSHAHSTGKGGAGNIYADHPERGRESHQGPLASLVEKVRNASSSRSSKSPAVAPPLLGSGSG